VNDTSETATPAQEAPRPGAREGTRERLLEAAGEMFAAHGFEGTTGKQICERAGVNPAAVNYHFGGTEGLYEAVLIEARDRAVGRQNRLFDLFDAPMAPEQKLRAITTIAVRALLASGRSAWILRLFGREVTNPSEVGRRILTSTAWPRVERARALVGELIGLPPNHPSVALGVLSLAAPLQILLIADRQLISTLHPALDLSPGGEEALVEHFYGYAMAGLKALRAGEARGQAYSGPR
jgi:AcrR family transcriptional regulator